MLGLNGGLDYYLNNMESSYEGLDENIIRQLSTIEQQRSISSLENQILYGLEEFKGSHNDRQDPFNKIEMTDSNITNHNLAYFSSSLSEIRQSLFNINKEIEMKKSKIISSENRLNRISSSLEKSVTKTDQIGDSITAFELRLKDFSCATEYFFGFFEAVINDADVRNDELKIKLQKIEGKIEEQAKGEKRVCPRKSKDDGKLILSVKCPKSRSSKVN